MSEPTLSVRFQCDIDGDRYMFSSHPNADKWNVRVWRKGDIRRPQAESGSTFLGVYKDTEIDHEVCWFVGWGATRVEVVLPDGEIRKVNLGDGSLTPVE